MDLTNFDFEHRVFTVPGAYIAPGRDKPLLHVSLGDLVASMSTDTVRKEFGIEPDSHDSQLLLLVEDALKYVKFISPGDSIPTEILTGEASWPIKDEHYERGRNMMLLKLASWVAGKPLSSVSQANLDKIMSDPKVEEHVQDGFKQAAMALKKDKEQVVQMLDQLGRELAYIEALRDYFAWIMRLPTEIKVAMSALSGDRQSLENAIRTQQLVEAPIRRYKTTFANVDSQMDDVVQALKNLPNVVEFVRTTRDELHFETLKWSAVEAEWQDDHDKARDKARNAISTLYRFLAQNFPRDGSW